MFSYLNSTSSKLPLFWIAFGSVFVMSGLAWYDACIQMLPGMGLDTIRFHLNGAKIADQSIDYKFTMGAEFYDHLLGLYYKLVIPNKFFGNMTSVAISSVALIFFIKCMDLLSIEKGQPFFLILFAFDPAFLLHGSLTLREAYELLFCIMAVYFGFKTLSSATVTHLLYNSMVFSACAVLLACFHIKALGLVAIILLVSLGIGYLFLKRRVEFKITVLIVVSFALLLLFNTGAVEWVFNILYLGENSAIGSIEKYRNTISNRLPRTLFPIDLDTSTIYSTVWSTLLIFMQHLFYPFIFSVTDFRDLIPASSGLLRLLLIVYSIFAVCKVKKERFNITVYFCIFVFLYCIVAGLWALGSSNYGQAFRHHSMTNWILILIAATVYGSSGKLQLK